MSNPSQFTFESGSRRGLSTALVVGSVLAMAASAPTLADDWLEQSTMTGDWDGSRSRRPHRA